MTLIFTLTHRLQLPFQCCESPLAATLDLFAKGLLARRWRDLCSHYTIHRFIFQYLTGAEHFSCCLLLVRGTSAPTVSKKPCGPGEMFGKSTSVSVTWVFPGRQRRRGRGRGCGLSPVGRPGSVHLECPGTLAYAGCHTSARPWPPSSAFTRLRRKLHSPRDQAHLWQEKAGAVWKLEKIQDHQTSILVLTLSRIQHTTCRLWREKIDVALYSLRSYY